MMGEPVGRQDRLFYEFDLEDMVPDDHLLRRIDTVLDLSWLRAEMKPLLQEVLDKDRIRQEGIFDPEETERLKREHLAGTANHSHVLWSLVVFQTWQSMWLKGTPGEL